MAAGQQAFMSETKQFVANAVDFNGSTDYVLLNSGFTGAADSSTGIFSAWMRFDGGDGAEMRFLASPSNALWFGRSGGNTFNVSVCGAGNNPVLTFASISTYTAGATWLNLLASWDTNFSAGNKIANLYVNDVNDRAVPTDVGVAFNVKYTQTAWALGRPAFHDTLLNGCLAEMYFAPGQFLDFSVTANRRRFISSTGKAVDLGIDGSTPTGTAPILYLKNPAASVGTNSGTGGDFTIGGAPGVCSTSPSS